jgi:uncharacterized protein YukE
MRHNYSPAVRHDDNQRIVQMTAAHVDPEKLRAFSTSLSRYCLQANVTSQGITRQLQQLGTTWTDPQFAQFAEMFRRTSAVIKSFSAEADKLTASLQKDAERAEQAQRIGPTSS